MTYGSQFGWLNCLSWSSRPLTLSINASCRLPSIGPNMFAIRPFGASTDCMKKGAHNYCSLKKVHIIIADVYTYYIIITKLYT